MFRICELRLYPPRKTLPVQEEFSEFDESVFSLFIFSPWFVNKNKNLTFCSGINLWQQCMLFRGIRGQKR